MDCCDASGGRVAIDINGRSYDTKAGIRYTPQGFEKSADAADNGNVLVKTKAMLPEAEITFADRCGLKLSDLIDGCRINLTLDFLDMRKKVLFTQATVIGRAQYSSESGDISGLKVVTAGRNVQEFTY